MKLILLDSEEMYLNNIKNINRFEHYEELNGEDVAELSVIGTQQLLKNYRFLYKDHFDTWHEFIIKGNDEIKDIDGIRQEIFAESSFYETLGDYIEDKRPSGSAQHALSVALETSRWEVGFVDDLGINQTNFYNISVKESVEKVARVWGGEIRTRVTVSGNKITGRYVDLFQKRGENRGKRFTYTKDINSLERITHRDDVITALYGYGKGEEVGDGFGRRINFSEINDGKRYLENNEAREKWGRLDENGNRVHTFGKVEFDDEEDIYNLKIETQKRLDEVSYPKVSYSADVVDLKAFGYDHEGTRLGDYVLVIDKDFEPELRILARVVDITHVPTHPDETRLTIGNFIEDITGELNKYEEYIDNFRGKQGIWDRSEYLNPDGTLDANKIHGIIQELNDQINADGGYVYISDDGEGIETYDKPKEENPTKVIQIKGGSLRIANSKKSNGEWDWRTVATGDGFTADAIVSGNIELTRGIRLTSDGEDIISADSSGDITLNANKIRINTVDLEMILEDKATKEDLENIELTPGEPGKDGKTAYEIAVENGFEGSEQEWLESLEGQDGDPGADGISVSSIDEEYYHSNSATSLVGGSWSETRPPWNKDKYIWSRTKTTFSNGEIQRTDPISLQGYHGEDGKPGEPGKDALPNYTWVKYSLIKTPTAQDMQDSPEGMIYRGVAYNKDKSQESTNPNDYVWEPMYDIEKLEDVENAVDDFRLLITIQDTRNANYAPSHYKDNFADYEVTERKINTAIGVPSENTYGVTITRVVDNQVEMSFHSGGEIFTRTGNATTDVWSDWSQSETVEGAEEKVSDSYGDATEYAIELVGDVETRAKQYVDGLVDPLIADVELIDDQYVELDAKINANKSEWRQTFSASGGVNEIRNSVGHAELEFWSGTGNITTVQNHELESYGSGSAFILGSNSKLEQNVIGPVGDRVFSAIVQKDSASSGYIEIEHDDNVEVISLNAGTEQNFVLVEKPFDLGGTNYTVRLVTDIGSEILFTNIMVNQGAERQGWSFAHDEIYGSTFRMNRNGFRVYQLDGTQYTAMTPDEFAGYAIVGGVWQRTFALNGDTTQMNKAYVEEEMRIGGISMVRIQSPTVNGVAFVRSGN